MKNVGYEKKSNMLNVRIIDINRLNDSVKGRVAIFVVLMTIIIALFVCIKRYIEEIKYEKKINVEYCGESEYVRTIDCASIIDEYGTDRIYRIKFELKTTIPGEINVYFQNGSTSKYQVSEFVNSTTEFQKYVLEVNPNLQDANETEAYRSFYGGYGSGVIPTVRRIEFEVVK